MGPVARVTSYPLKDMVSCKRLYKLLITLTKILILLIFAGEGHLSAPRPILSPKRPTNSHNESEEARDQKLLQASDRGHVQTA